MSRWLGPLPSTFEKEVWSQKVHRPEGRITIVNVLEDEAVFFVPHKDSLSCIFYRVVIEVSKSCYSSDVHVRYLSSHSIY